MLFLAKTGNDVLLYFKIVPERGVAAKGECAALSPYLSSFGYSGFLPGFLGWLCHSLIALGTGTKKEVTGYHGIFYFSVEKQCVESRSV